MVRFDAMTHGVENSLVTDMLQAVRAGNDSTALAAYKKWIDVVERERREERNDS